MPVLWVLPLWVLPLLLCSEPRVDACPPLCTCSSAQATEEPRSVLCRDPEILTVPTNVPVNTVKLRLEKTQISRLSRAAFYNLSDLRFLWVTYSALRSVHPSSFVNLKTLRELRLGGNHLTAFPWEGLRDTPRLQILDLHNNLVSSLPAHAALFLANVTYLDLSSNRLTLLPAELLDLWFPLPEQQQTTVQTRVLGLHDNPWLCDCQISLVTSLSVSLDSPVVLLDPALICIRSVGQGGVLLMPVWWQRCVRPSVQPAATRVVSPVGSNVILRCEATGYPTPTLSWVKAVAYTDCCQQDIPQDDDQLPKNLQSVMQGSPRVGVRWSIISLNGLSYKDAGEYRCRARNMAGTSEAPIKLRITGSSRTRGPPKQRPPKQRPTKQRPTQPPKQRPPKQRPPKQRPTKQRPTQPPKQRPPKQRPPKQRPTKQRPTKQRPTQPPKQRPPKQRPPKQRPTKQRPTQPPKQRPPKQRPPKQRPTKQRPTKQRPTQPPKQRPPKQRPPKQRPTKQRPTKQRPTQPPKQRPTQPPKQRPTQPPKQSPTQPPKQRPTQLPKQRPPKQSPTRPPKQRPTQPPKQSPTQLPKQRPTQLPKQRPPKQRPTQPPKQRPTQLPKQRPLKQSPTQPPKQRPPKQRPTQPPPTSNRKPNQVPPSIRILEGTLQNSTALNKTLSFSDVSKTITDTQN